MSIIKNHPDIQEALVNRWEELKIGNRAIVLQAKEAGFDVSETAICRYKKSKNLTETRSGLSEENVIKLATLYGVFVSVNVGIATIFEGKPKFKIVSYNKEKCDKIFKTIYGQK